MINETVNGYPNPHSAWCLDRKAALALLQHKLSIFPSDFLPSVDKKPNATMHWPLDQFAAGDFSIALKN